MKDANPLSLEYEGCQSFIPCSKEVNMKKQKLIRFDWAIKTILRDKTNFDVLEGLLSALLKDNITVLRILESESNQDTPRQKFNRVDIMVVDSQGTYMIIEIQNEHECDYLERLLFGTSTVIVQNLDIGQSFSELKKVISISIQYFNLGLGDDYIYYGATCFRGLHTNKPLVVRKKDKISDKKYVFKERDISREIFPEYYLINVERFSDQINSDIDEWIYMLKHEDIPEDFKSKNIEKARQKLLLTQMSEIERKEYDKYLINTVRDQDMIQTARDEGMLKGIEKGEKIGLEKGEKIGLEKGEKMGREKGEKEGMIQMLLLSLNARFGNLSKEIEYQINSLDNPDMIRNLISQSFTCKDQKQLLSLITH